MINLYDKGTGMRLGNLTEDQLQFLIDQLEEESLDDKDYTISQMVIDFLASQGADSELLELLHQALGFKDEVEVRWSSS